MTVTTSHDNICDSIWRRRFGMEEAGCGRRITRLTYGKVDFSPGKNVLARERLAVLCAAFVRVRANLRTDLGLRISLHTSLHI